MLWVGEDGGFDDLDMIFFLSLSPSLSLVVADTKVPGAEIYYTVAKFKKKPPYSNPRTPFYPATPQSVSILSSSSSPPLPNQRHPLQFALVVDSQ